jgi:K+-sensing histidine kinase KdpD
MATQSASQDEDEKETYRPEHRILIPVANPDTINGLVDLAVLINEKKGAHPIYALNVVCNNSQESLQSGKKLLEKVATLGAASDSKVKMISRYDLNIASGIINVVREKNISDVIIGLHQKSNIGDSFLGSMTDSLLANVNRMICIFKSTQPIGTFKRLVVAIPERAEFESGFTLWCDRIFTLASQTGASIHFCTNNDTLSAIKAYVKKKRYSAQYTSQVLADWDDFLILTGIIELNDLLVVITARKSSLSYNAHLDKLPKQLANYFTNNSYIVLYPEQFKEGEVDKNIDAHKII